MARPFVPKPHAFSVVAPFIATLAILLTPASVAQLHNTSQAPDELSAVPRSSLSPTAQHTPGAPWWDTKHGDLSTDSSQFTFLLFPTVFYDTSQGGVAVSIAVADVNRDGKSDLLVANCTDTACLGHGSIGVLLGNGDGTFQPVVTYDSGGFIATAVAVADVNGDGKPDLLVANCGSDFNCGGNGSVGVLLGNGDGTFQTVVTYDTGQARAASIAVADVNRDGKPDVLLGVSCTFYSSCVNGNGQAGMGVSVVLGKGDGTFQAPVTYYSGGTGGSVGEPLAVADVNGDGKPDLAVANGSAGVLLGNGDGTFQPVVTYDSGGSARSIAVRDVNGDGKPDLLVANDNGLSVGTVGVLLGNGNGTFQAPVTYDTLGLGFSLAAIDVNNNGKPDLVLGSGGVRLLLGNGDGTFQPTVIYNPGVVVGESVAVGDLNGDGKPDLALIDVYLNGAAVLLNNKGAPPSTTSLAASVNPVTVNQTVTYTATVTPQSGGTVQ